MPDFEKLLKEANKAQQATQYLTDAIMVLERGTIGTTGEPLTPSQRASVVAKVKSLFAQNRSATTKMNAEVDKP